jgi:MoaA/NifB/PqqE/SkfB family radical SAM enzyme
MIKRIKGFKADLMRLRMHLKIAVIVMVQIRHSVDWFKILSKVLSKRKTVQGLQKISRFIKSDGRYFFSDTIPGWPSRAFKGFFRAEASRILSHPGVRVPLTTVFISITSRCPMRCRHCYEWDNLSKEEALSLDDLKIIIKKIKEYGVYHIHLSGGEPLERIDDLLSLISYSSEDADVWIDTSGFGLTPEKAFLMKKAGLTGVEISLDHYDENEHNRFRSNEESFRWVDEAAKNCINAGILTSLSLCATNTFVTKENLDKYTDLAMCWGICFIRFLEPKEIARFKGELTQLSDNQIAILEEFYLGAGSPSKPVEYPIISYPGFHQRRIGCLGAGNRYIHIDPKGNIHACPFCRGSAGNAITGSIEDAILILRNQGCQLYRTNSSD